MTGKGSFNFMWMRCTATSKIGLIFLSLICILMVYLTSCLVLYAFVQLTGSLSFSWTNGLWTMILLSMSYIIFGHSTFHEI